MNKQSRFTGSLLAALTAVMMLALPVAGNAQETTTTVRGTVTAPDGSPAVGQTVTVTDTRTNSVRNTRTNSSGAFDVRGLPVGGPYTTSSAIRPVPGHPGHRRFHESIRCRIV